MISANKYEPKSSLDIVFGNDESRMRIEDILTGQELLPANGKTGILLYGSYGTGKTTLAKLLPSDIEFCKSQDDLAYEAEFISCQQGFKGPTVMTLIQKILDVSSLNASGIHYFIIDEVDNLTALAQQSLKSAMNAKRAIFILTTNNISKIDRGVVDRCIAIEMNAPLNSQLVPLAKKIASDMNVVLNANQINSILSTCNGSFRNVIPSVARYARRHNGQFGAVPALPPTPTTP